MLIVPAIMLYVANVFHMHSFICSILSAVALFFSHTILIIVILFQDAEFGDISKTLVHPSTSASIIIVVAIEKLLNGVFLDFFFYTCNFG